MLMVEGLEMRRIWAALPMLLPGLALACALPPSIVLTLPLNYYLSGAAFTVALTAVLSGLAGRRSWPAPRRLAVFRAGHAADWMSYLSFLIFLGLLALGIAGPRDPMHNLLTLGFWAGVWVLLPLVSLLLGDLWGALNPWRGPVRMLRLLIGWRGNIGLHRFGAWPAVAGLAGFSWFQSVALAPEDPLVLAQAAGIYWLIIFLAGVAEGEDWLAEGEFLHQTFGMIARLSPFWLRREGGRCQLWLGLPGTQILGMPPLSRSAQVFVLLLLAALSFDGLQGTFFWLGVIGQNPLEFTGRSAVQWENTLGLIAAFALTWGSIRGALWLGARLSGQALPAGPVMLSFLAIAAGYHVAHYLLMLLTAGQYLVTALNDPLLRGDQLLGLDPFWVSMGFLTDRSVMTALWNLQFVIIVGVHALAVLLALNKAPGRHSGLAHLPLSVLMVGYTIFGLWLLSSPTGV